jgi:membrane associated rhomboid family serine protease
MVESKEAAEPDNFKSSLAIVFTLVGVLWIVWLLQEFAGWDFSEFGNWPHHIQGLKGILFSPFIHGSFEHIVSNTLPALVLMMVLLNAYPKVALPVLFFIHIVSGILVWTLAPDTGIHIGISGIVYGIAAFLITSGLLRKDRVAVTISIFVGLTYGAGILASFIPTKGVSWQSHLYGAVSGLIAAIIVRKVGLPPKHEFELEVHEDDKHFFDTVQNNTEPPTTFTPEESSPST